MIDLIAVFALLGSTFAIFKMMLREVNQPLFIVGLSAFISGLGYTIYQTCIVREKLSFSYEHIRIYLGLIFITFLMPQALRFWSLKYLSSIKLGLITNLAPFFTAALAYFLNVGKINLRKFIALCIGFVGMLPVLLSQSSSGGDADVFLFFSWPEIAAIFSVICFCYGIFIRRQAMLKLKSSSAQINMIGLTGMGLVMLPFSLIHSGVPHVSSVSIFLGWLSLFILIMHVLGYTLLNSMIKKYNPTMLALAGFVRPLTVVGIGWLFLGEAISWHFFLSMALVLFGLVLYYKEDLVISHD